MSVRSVRRCSARRCLRARRGSCSSRHASNSDLSRYSSSPHLKEDSMRRVILTVFGSIIPVAIAFAAATGYHILSEIPVGGEGGWDYLTVDTAARRLYVSHGTHVVVIDLDANKIVGDIPDTPRVHGIATAPA